MSACVATPPSRRRSARRARSPGPRTSSPPSRAADGRESAGGSRLGEAQRHRRAVIGFVRAALDLDAPTVRADDAAHELEAEPLGVERSATALEEKGELVARDPRSVVLDRDGDELGVLL